MDRPAIRPSVTAAFKVGNMEFYLTFGLHPETKQVFEVFFDGMTEGSSMKGLLTSFCVMVSRALQRGDTPTKMLDGTIGVMPFPPFGPVYTLNNDGDWVKRGEVPSVTYMIIKAVEWVSADFPESFAWS